MKKAEIILDKNYLISDIDKRIYGSFIEHLGRAVYGGIYQPGSPLADENGFRKDTLEVIRELDVPTVRYPGGNFVSNFDWQDSIGPKDKRPRRVDLAWEVIETNQFGLDEFCDWAKMANISPMMAINLGTKGVSEARDIVEYCNFKSGTKFSDMRIANGHKDPHNIKLWCLGNEMDAPWQIGHKTAEEYARIACESAKAMKIVDPSIELIACGSSHWGMKTFGTWEDTVLTECYDFVDYISMHAYYGNSENDIKSYLANSLSFEGFIDSVIATCDHVKGKLHKKKTINISFDEWNAWYHSNNDPVEKWSIAPHQLEDHYNFEDALLIGDLMISLINRSDRVKIACLAQLVNVIAPIMTTDTSIFRQTIFYPFMYTSKYGRGKAIKSIVKSPFYSTKKYDKVPFVDCAVVDNEEKQQLALFIVNKGDEPIELDSDLRQYADYRVQECICMKNDDFKAINDENNPFNIVPAPNKDVKFDGKLNITLPAYSWNIVVLGK